MKTTPTLTIMMLLLTSTLSTAAPGTVAELPAELRDALVHDAACAKTGRAPTTKPDEFLKSPINIQEVRSGTRLVGSIVTFADSCHCHDANCGTYVYLHKGTAYKLAITGSFASLHPTRFLKQGLPSLTAKFQQSDSVAETTVYDWNGKRYEPALCATVTQTGNQKRPRIVRHACPAESRSR